MRRLIVTADDFGASAAVNEAVERAHREGILRCASLMIGAPATADAVARARRLPTLRVGLHLVVVDGRPVLPPERVPALVDANGRFDAHLLRASARWFFSPRARRQLEAEIRAQFEAFAATGLALDHVNAHKHMHLHPTVLGLILRVGRAYGMRAVRLPCEPIATLRHVRGKGWPGAALGAALLTPWTQLLRWRIGRAGLRYNRYVFGLSTSGAMDEETLLRILQALPEGSAEVYLHPATAPPGTAAERELGALLSPRVQAALRAAAIEPTSFSELR